MSILKCSWKVSKIVVIPRWIARSRRPSNRTRLISVPPCKRCSPRLLKSTNFLRRLLQPLCKIKSQSNRYLKLLRDNLGTVSRMNMKIFMEQVKTTYVLNLYWRTYLNSIPVTSSRCLTKKEKTKTLVEKPWIWGFLQSNSISIRLFSLSWSTVRSKIRRNLQSLSQKTQG